MVGDRLARSGCFCTAVFFLIFFSSFSHAQMRPAPARIPQEHASNQLQSLLDHAAALPIEYQADLVLGLIEKSPEKLSARASQVLLKSLMERSAEAIYPSRPPAAG